MSIQSVGVLITSSALDYELYSPDVFNNTLYLGGWLTTADIGPDQLYQSSTTEDAPTSLVWTGPAPYGQYHLNDPSVVQEANGTLAMFMTALPNAYGYDSQMLSRNVTGLATSTNNGASWTWQGIVIGQDNGIDATGAWSPSTLVAAGGDIDVWYNTGWTDVNTGDVEPIRVLRNIMNPTGTQALSTVTCVNALTSAAISAENVDVYQSSNGTYWMVGNDYSTATGSSGKIVLYDSQDGVSWTPWSTSGATLLSPLGNTVLMTPTITGVSGNTLNLMYSEQVGASATVQDAVTIELSTQPTTAYFAEATTFGGIATSTLDVTGQTYTGPVSYLQNQLIYTGDDNVNLTALSPNVFLCSGAGEDALAALSGQNVLDGGSGSNFMTAGSGSDVFFLDANAGTDTWSTVNGFKAGDQITIWGMTPSMGNLSWLASQGAPGSLGATVHIAEGLGHWASLSLAGLTTQQAQALTATFGTSGGIPYLHLQG